MKHLSCIVLCAVLASSFPALASDAYATFAVTAVVTDNCRVPVTSIPMGHYGSRSEMLEDMSRVLTATCTTPTPFTVKLEPGRRPERQDGVAREVSSGRGATPPDHSAGASAAVIRVTFSY